MDEAVDLRAAVEAEHEVPEDVEQKTVDVTWSPEEAAEAEAMGWIPPERAKKLPEGKSYVGPVEFMERNPLYGKVKQMESVVKDLAAHNQKIAEVERKKAEQEFTQKLAALEAQKIEALDNADHERVVEIDKEIRAAEKTPPKEERVDPTLTNWIADGNDWYEKDSFLRIEADIIGERLYYQEGKSGKDLLDAAKSYLKEKYPHKFENPNRDKPSPVEGATQRPSGKGSSSVKDLTADERVIYNNFKRMGVFAVEGSEQKYFNDVISLRD